MSQTKRPFSSSQPSQAAPEICAQLAECWNRSEAAVLADWCEERGLIHASVVLSRNVIATVVNEEAKRVIDALALVLGAAAFEPQKSLSWAEGWAPEVFEAEDRRRVQAEQSIADERMTQMRLALELRDQGLSFKEIGLRIPVTMANQKGRLKSGARVRSASNARQLYESASWYKARAQVYQFFTSLEVGRSLDKVRASYRKGVNLAFAGWSNEDLTRVLATGARFLGHVDDAERLAALASANRLAAAPDPAGDDSRP